MAKTGNSFPTLATKRLRLRQFAQRDLQGQHACFGDEEAMRYWNSPACKSEAETGRWLEYLAKTTSAYDYLAWAVADKPGDRCIGMVNYHHREARNRTPRDRLHPGAGAAGPRADDGGRRRRWSTYCLEGLAVHRIEALIHPDNAASIRLVERLGFRCEGGPLRDRWRRGEGYMSVMMYALHRRRSSLSPSFFMMGSGVGVRGSSLLRRLWLPLTLTLSP